MGGPSEVVIIECFCFGLLGHLVNEDGGAFECDECLALHATVIFGLFNLTDFHS